MYIYIYMYIYIICIRRNNSYKAIYQLDLDLGLTVTLKRSLAEIGEEIENQTKRLNLTIIQQFTIHQKSGKEEGSKYEIEKDGKRKRGERWRWRWEADQKKKKKRKEEQVRQMNAITSKYMISGLSCVSYCTYFSELIKYLPKRVISQFILTVVYTFILKTKSTLYTT